MGKMFFELTDDDRAALERIRVARGARSHAEALRGLIRHADDNLSVIVVAPQANADNSLWSGEYIDVSEAVPIGRERPKPGSLLKKR